MIRIIVSVKPNASRDEIQVDAEGNISIKIKEAPIDGAANMYLLKFLSKEFGIPKSHITLEKGTNSRFKKIMLPLDQLTFDKLLSKYKK